MGVSSFVSGLGELAMDDAPAIARRRVAIVNAHGLHMRPAGKFVNLANSFRSEVWVDHQGTRANGKSILDMTGLAAECGTTLDLEARGPDAEASLDALAGLVAAGFHMTEEDYRQPTGPGHGGSG
jgi:phosphocarrier protein